MAQSSKETQTCYGLIQVQKSMQVIHYLSSTEELSLTTTGTFSHVQWPRILLIAMLC